VGSVDVQAVGSQWKSGSGLEWELVLMLALMPELGHQRRGVV
jgi:hypothetical protein